MNVTKAINKLVKDNNYSQATLAKAMGYKSPASIGNVALRCDLKVSFLIEICHFLGYEIVIRPTRGDNKAARTFVIDELPPKPKEE